MTSSRRRAAWLCAVALAGAAVALPAMHVVVHAIEDARAEAAAPRWRVEASRKAKPRVAHSHRHDGAEHRHDHGPRHHHGPRDDRGGPHGADSPEHLQAMLLAAAPATLPPPSVRVAPLAPVAPVARALPVPPRSPHGARAPPHLT